MNLNSRIGSRLAILRKRNGLTQEQLAEKLDISIKHCSAVERGLSCLSLEKLIEISNIFDVSIDSLVKEAPLRYEPFGCLCTELPPSIINILRSGNDDEIKLLIEYLSLYTKLRPKQK